MGTRICKTEKTEYPNIRKRINENGIITYIANFQKYKHGNIISRTSKVFNCVKEAAIALDKHLIAQGKEPVNILIRK